MGGFILVRRAAYEAVGGHAAVRHEVAEDLRLAQHMHRHGRRVTLVAADRFVSVRMYRSLREIVNGWSKNVGIASGQTMPDGLNAAAPWLLVAWMIVVWVLPPAALLAGLVGLVGPGVLTWAVLATGASLLFHVAVYRALRLPLLYALLYPAGAAVAAAIFLRSTLRGRHVSWKGRTYRTSDGSANSTSPDPEHIA